MTSSLIRLFVKNYEDTTNSQVRERYGKFAGVVGIVSNFLLFLLKMVVGTIFNSIAVTADAVNNLSDCASSIITLFGFKLSGKPADAKHPYGHARMEYISGLVVSFLILVLGLQLIQSSVGKIIHPEEAGFRISKVFFGALVISILIKIWQNLFYFKIANLISSTTLRATAVDSRNDVLATSAVLTAAVVSEVTGFDLDGYMGVGVALFILVSGVRLVNETISPLLGTAPTKELVEGVYKKILSYEGIIGLHDLRVHSYGPGRYFASVHCEVSAEQDIMVGHDLIDDIEQDFLENEGINLVIHLDPVVADDEKTNQLKTMVEKEIREISPEIGMHDFRVVWGVTHANLIFDIVVPFEARWSDDQLVEVIKGKIKGINSSYNPVITVDHCYVPPGIVDNLR